MFATVYITGRVAMETTLGGESESNESWSSFDISEIEVTLKISMKMLSSLFQQELVNRIRSINQEHKMLKVRIAPGVTFTWSYLSGFHTEGGDGGDLSPS